MEGTAGAPPTRNAISLGLPASLPAQIPDPFGPRNSPLRSDSTVPLDRAPALPSQNLPNRSLVLKDLSTHSSRTCFRPRGPRRARPPASDQLPSRLGLRLPFLFLVSCHFHCGPLRRRAPGLPGRWRLQLLCLLWPSLTPRFGRVLKVLSARRPAVRWKFAGSWLGAGEGGGER